MKTSQRVRAAVAGPLVLSSVLLCLAGCPPNAVLTALQAQVALSKNGALAAPQIGPSPGSYSFDLTGTYALAITEPTSGAVIHYTITSGTQGMAPTVSSPVYDGPVSITGDGTAWTVEAMAVEDGWVDSPVATANYQINYGRLSTPTFSLAGGVYSSAQTLTINVPNNGTSGIQVYYTTASNGALPSDPTTSSATVANGGSVSLSGTGTKWTAKALAHVSSGFADSDIATSGTFTLSYPPAAEPTFSTSPSAPPYYGSVTVTIHSASTSGGATIYYTTDGSTPSSTNPTATVYTGAVTITNTGTNLMALATGGPYSDSPLHGAVYTLVTQVPTPSMNPPTETLNGSVDVTITDADPNATIYYTTDGSTPTTSSTLYTNGVSLSGVLTTTTLKAIAVHAGMTNSAVDTEKYTFGL